MSMYYTDEEYPFDHREVPSVMELLETLEWDVVCVLDACRWDAFEKLCGEAEAARSPRHHTKYWVEEGWGESDADWDDLTYVSANPVTSFVSEEPDVDVYMQDIVGEYIPAFQLRENGEDVVWDGRLGSAHPEDLTQYVIDEIDDPPMLVHYTQPHNPFIGEVSLRIDQPIDELKREFVFDGFNGRSPEAYVVKNGHASTDYYRLAYLENLRLAWEHTSRIRDRYDRVIFTADHGEHLGPDSFGHGEPNSERTRVVPFAMTWEPDLPDPEDVGGHPDHQWRTVSDS